MRIRQIKPGILSNEDIVNLGPYAYILFTGLWMIADRFGRLEYRPQRIKALVMPLWDEMTTSRIEDLVNGLVAARMLRIYRVAGRLYIEVVNWGKHQRPDSREAKSDIPGPSNGDSGEFHGNSGELRGVPGNSDDRTENWELGVKSGGDGRLQDTCNRESANEPVSPPPQNLTRKRGAARPKPERHQPARRPHSPVDPPERKPPSKAEALAATAHNPEDVAVLRQSLVNIAENVRMPPPDDAIIIETLDAARGAPIEQLLAYLLAFWRKGRFESMRSWGFVPHLVRQGFRAAAASA